MLTELYAMWKNNVTEFVRQRLEDGRKRVVRHGHLPERKVMTGIGAVSVKVPRSRDRKAKNQEQPIRFSLQILPPYVRHSKSDEAAIPYLYLKGIFFRRCFSSDACFVR